MINLAVLNAAQASEALRHMGMKITPEVLRAGIEQGVFPFGIVIETGATTRKTIVFEKKLCEWAKEMGREM